ncbi:inositol monophosphatase family protein [Paenibacillus yanchengensis]|uniref:Inositol monophosphatase family protein n=1 Tax=Paenibacillus yanchengensis TaxID=2035833 RepID=A0ABW4YI80_9BACL
MANQNIVLTYDTCRQLLLDVCQLIDQLMPAIEQQRNEITVKDDGSLVTAADVMLEQQVHQFLRQKLGEVVFVGEETYTFHAMTEQTGIAVIFDPIDGTENFCMGLKEWGMAISIWQNGQHVGSCLYMPELGERLMTGDKLQQAAVSSRMTALSVAVNERLLQLLAEPGQYRMSGCSVYNLYYVIKGSFAQFIHPKGAYIWDILPGMMLALEHGCHVFVDDSLYNGQWLDPTRKHKLHITHSRTY